MTDHEESSSDFYEDLPSDPKSDSSILDDVDATIIDECETNIISITKITFDITDDDINSALVTKILNEFVDNLHELGIKISDVNEIKYFLKASEYEAVYEYIESKKQDYNKDLLIFIRHFIELSQRLLNILSIQDSLSNNVCCYVRTATNIQASINKNIIEHNFITDFHFIGWEFHLYVDEFRIIYNRLIKKSFTQPE